MNEVLNNEQFKTFMLDLGFFLVGYLVGYFVRRNIDEPYERIRPLTKEAKRHMRRVGPMPLDDTREYGNLERFDMPGFRVKKIEDSDSVVYQAEAGWKV